MPEAVGPPRHSVFSLLRVVPEQILLARFSFASLLGDVSCWE